MEPASRVALSAEEFYIHPDEVRVHEVAFNESYKKCKSTAKLYPEGPGCDVDFDSLLCWPKTQLSTTAYMPCFKELLGLKYDSTQNATRYCNADGQWDNYTNYEYCAHIPDPSPTGSAFPPHTEITTFIYFIGYIISLLSLSLAVIVFLQLKDLRCLRNKIHLNLFFTYILSALMWILTLIIQLFVQPDGSGCIFLVILLHYFSLTNFFWMMVEGLYLYTLVVQTFSGDSLRLKMYALIGWGLPAVFVGCWTISKAILLPSSRHENLAKIVDENGLVIHSKVPEIGCTWLEESSLDWIYQGPACAVIVLNFIFLCTVMRVLITKLRSANTAETRQYRKAAKALLILIPLLGSTYLIVIAGPEGPGLISIIFAFSRAFLLSTQGFAVSLFYCFLNSEVRQTIRHRFNNFRDERSIRNGSTSISRRYNTSKDYLRSRTESLRTEECIVFIKAQGRSSILDGVSENIEEV